MPALRSRGYCVQAYADDLAVLVTGADVLWIRGMAYKAINIAANWASEQELQFSSKKTEIVLFAHKRNPDLGSLSMNGSNGGAESRTWARDQLKYDGFPVLCTPKQTEKMPQFCPNYDVITKKKKKKVFTVILTVFPVQIR